MEGSVLSSEGASQQFSLDEDPIMDLAEGPWPGPLEVNINNPSIQFGNTKLDGSVIIAVMLNKHRKGNHWFRTAKISISTDLMEPYGCNYRAEVRIYEDSQPIFHGRCIQVIHNKQGSLELDCCDSSWDLANTVLPALMLFGMSKREQKFWMPQFAGMNEPRISNLSLNRELRPFLYAVPLLGIQASESSSIFLNDLGLVSGEYDNTFAPLIQQLKLDEKDAVWHKEQLKSFGIVFAHSLLEAESKAIERAKLVADLINFAVKAGVSHWIDRDHIEPLEWNTLLNSANIHLSDWILVREVAEIKGWARIVKLTKPEMKLELEIGKQRLMQFLERFKLVTAGNDFRQQLGQNYLSKSEAKLVTSLQSAIHWYNVGIQQEQLWDRFLAYWIALETILDSITYPKVFQGSGKAIRNHIADAIDQAPYPQTTGISYKLSPDLLKNRLLSSDWPLIMKLDLFAQSMGINLTSSDKQYIGKLARIRGQGVHKGQVKIHEYASDVESLSNLIERLLIASSLCVFRQVGDDCQHIIDVYSANPAGGIATVLLNGQKTSYEWHAKKLPSGDWTQELWIEGKVYDSENSELRFHNQRDS